MNRLEKIACALHRSNTSIIEVSIDRYLDYLEKNAKGGSETSPKYTLEQKKEAIYNDQLRDEILKNSPKEEIRLMYEEISQIKKIVLEKIKEK